mmetsp:Transcript_10326/g.31704  ORF Transcript_10326/g.31704 Transcript_10326/m.31704 type:complete len:161 (+) Transcript_10326:230-712(+)
MAPAAASSWRAAAWAGYAGDNAVSRALETSGAASEAIFNLRPSCVCSVLRVTPITQAPSAYSGQGMRKPRRRRYRGAYGAASRQRARNDRPKATARRPTPSVRRPSRCRQQTEFRMCCEGSAPEQGWSGRKGPTGTARPAARSDPRTQLQTQRVQLVGYE